MHNRETLILLCLVGLANLLALNMAHTLDEEPLLDHKHIIDYSKLSCGHNSFSHEALLLDVDEEILPDNIRMLQTGSSYPKIRIAVDYSNMISGTTESKNYIQSELVPAVVDYFQAALAVKQPLTSALKLPASTKSICGFNTPKALQSGVQSDFYIMVSSKIDSSSNWVASAGSCYLSSVTKRPLVAQMVFNMYYTKPANGDPLVHEKNMYLAMHELLHALGFSGSSFSNFINSSGKTLTAHIKSVVLNGSTRTVLDVEPLTSRLRAHYGCPTLPGAFIEDDGGSGTAGSHFERRHFLFEAMTSGVMQGLKLSEFSLAVMEGSGWYLPDYSYADPFFVGQGEGCNFLYQSCSTSSILNFDEFCSGSGRGCAAVGTSGGVCSSDASSDNCRFYIPPIQYSCESEDASEYARYPKLESYGRAAGSKCFTGDLSTSAKSSQTSFCFKYNCVGSGLSTKLEVMIGSSKLTCSSQGPLKVTGYNGQIDCPDPLRFCNTIGKKKCARNCMGRGTCVNNQCICKKGYSGIDCAMKA